MTSHVEALHLVIQLAAEAAQRGERMTTGFYELAVVALEAAGSNRDAQRQLAAIVNNFKAAHMDVSKAGAKGGAAGRGKFKRRGNRAYYQAIRKKRSRWGKRTDLS